ncbi:SLC13 family permease [Roseiconus lacunae]|uniref:SLC13 family permease n=1 Tax=Roseiconus lacunae TaxID=2605694 RepID=A0ABT7PQ98_9BACT|nr:SLC13 family permease [Roseiconus lacunae]MDM4018636.1 SLC13 family permease [Roseiconus lacunae]
MTADPKSVPRKNRVNVFAIVGGPLAAVVVGGALIAYGHQSPVAIAAAIVTWCAVWWITEPIPIAVTSLLPLAIFPATGVLSSSQIAGAFGHQLVLLFMGGLMLSMAMERSNAHRRLALIMVRLFGGHGESGADPRRVVFGFMAAAAVLSMWISNGATALMMLPIALAVVDRSSNTALAPCLLMGIAFAASVGGTGTPIGTPPNLIFIDNYKKIGGPEPSFLQWAAWTWPIIAIMLPIQALWLTRRLPSRERLTMPEVGAWRSEEKRTLAVFAITATLWVTRTAPFGGWSTWLHLPDAHDSSVALLAVVAMHLIPNGKGEMLLTWNDAVRIPWGILLLCAGGFAIAEAFRSTGISLMIGQRLSGLGDLHPFWIVAVICLAVTFLTEVTSNTATANLLLPILALIPADDPKLIMIPATISASFAFMMPAATFPNAIVFASGKIRVSEMVREGFALNLIGVIVVATVSYFLL